MRLLLGIIMWFLDVVTPEDSNIRNYFTHIKVGIVLLIFLAIIGWVLWSIRAYF